MPGNLPAADRAACCRDPARSEGPPNRTRFERNVTPRWDCFLGGFTPSRYPTPHPPPSTPPTPHPPPPPPPPPTPHTPHDGWSRRFSTRRPRWGRVASKRERRPASLVPEWRPDASSRQTERGLGLRINRPGRSPQSRPHVTMARSLSRRASLHRRGPQRMGPSVPESRRHRVETRLDGSGSTTALLHDQSGILPGPVPCAKSSRSMRTKSEGERIVALGQSGRHVPHAPREEGVERLRRRSPSVESRR